MEQKLDVSTSRKNRIENNQTEVLVIESNRIETHLYRFSPTAYEAYLCNQVLQLHLDLFITAAIVL